MPRRNVVFFHAESWNGRMLGGLGHPALRQATPNFERIAASGAWFENAYCSHPICCPSRANMWSGRYTHNSESWNNHKGLESGMWSLVNELAQTHTFQRFGKLDCMSGGHSLLARLSAWLGPSGINRPVLDNAASQAFSVSDDSNARCHEGDWQKVDRAIAFLEKEKDGDKPFFLYLSTSLVHPAYRTNRYWLSKIPEESVDIPPKDNNDHPVRRYQRMAKAWRGGFEDETVRLVRRIYMAMCAEADAMLGTVHDAVNDLGLLEDTYFVFSGDHGEMAMEHQDWGKMTMHEGSVRVPMLLAGPGVARGRRLPNPVSVVDLCPTLMEMAGLSAREGLDGQSLMPLATGRAASGRDTAYACFMGCTLNTSAYMLRKDRWKYVAYAGYPSMLFDVLVDPDELSDLAEERQDIAAELDRELRSIVDYERCHRDWIAYCKEAFRQWRRQAKRGLYVDGGYSLKSKPSSDYWRIMANTFTGYDERDEEIVEAWLTE